MGGITASGLASGMDTSSIIDSLVKLEQRPLDSLRSRQAAMRTQVSLLGDVASKLEALRSAAQDLAKGNVLALKSTTTPTGFSAAPGSSTSPGRYAVQVQDLAQAAKARSQAFAAGETVTGGTLDLTVMGKSYSVEVADGASLADVAYALNQSGAPLSATVLTTQAGSYLSLSNRDTGFPLGTDAALALSVTETSTGVLGKPLAAALTSAAKNAKVTVDGLDFESQTNDVTGAIPGTTLSLKVKTAAPEDLVLATDLDATTARVQTFVDAFNAVNKLVQAQLNVGEKTDRDRSLAGETSLRSLQDSLRRLISRPVPGLTDVRSLADLGLKTERDGSLSLKKETLEKAVARSPSSVNALFAKGTDGIGAVTAKLVDSQTNSTDGILTSRKKSLDSLIKSLDTDAERFGVRIEAFRRKLTAQFAAMEKIVSSMKASGDYLSQQSALAAKSS